MAGRAVPGVLRAVDAIGLTNRSACGHTMRNVMACPDAGVGLDEPFDCSPDALLVSDALLARSATLNCELPSRINFSFGGCPECAGHARLNDGGFESRVVNGDPGYRLWAAGSLGTMAYLALPLIEFLPRAQALAAAEALVDVLVAFGDLEDPKKGRMKFVVEAMGDGAFRTAFGEAFDLARQRHLADPIPPLEAMPPSTVADILRHAPEGGWSSGVRPQRTPGLALVTVNVPLGDLGSGEARTLAGMAAMGDGVLYLTRNQNVRFHDVPIAHLPELRLRLSEMGLSLEGADSAVDVRACTGSAVCSLAITAAPDAGADLTTSAALARNAVLRVHVSGCPNSCAQHQVADIGLSGAKVRVRGATCLGYRVWLGADLASGRLGDIAGRVTEGDLREVIDAIVGAWESLRWTGETMGETVGRIGLEAFASHLSTLTDGFEPGLECDPDGQSGQQGSLAPLAVAV